MVDESASIIDLDEGVKLYESRPWVAAPERTETGAVIAQGEEDKKLLAGLLLLDDGTANFFHRLAARPTVFLEVRLICFEMMRHLFSASGHSRTACSRHLGG